VTVNRTHRDNQVWLYSFIAVMTHLLADFIVHQPDMAAYPNADTKYGLSLWRYIPVISWIVELLLILIAVVLIRTRYGTKKFVYQ
jgi:ribose/xylose/arabinose/galactoside ABC-type transport system permease subunit